MLNFLTIVKKKKSFKLSDGKGSNIRVHKRDIPMNKEWYNSLYSFNKNSVRFIPAVYDNTFKLLNLYFNMTNNWIEKKIQSFVYKKVRRTSGRKLWISNPEFKYFHEKINITIYVYNRTYNFLKKKLEFFEFILGSNIKKEKYFKPQTYSTKTKLTNLKLLNREFPLYLGTNRVIYDKSNDYYIEIIKWLKLNKYTNMTQYRSKILSIIDNKEKNKLVELLKLLKTEHYNYLINLFSKHLMYLKVKQIVLFNKFKYNELYLSTLTEFLKTVYKKNIEWNIVTLKNYYLSTSILLQIIATKVKKPKLRGKSHIPLSYAMHNIKVPILSKSKLKGEEKYYIGVQNVKLNEFLKNKKDYLNQFLLVKKKSKLWSNRDIDRSVLSNLENKILAGVYIKIAGRLSKRYRADKSIKKFRYRGTLKNVYSAHRNLSSSLSRGYSSINVEKAIINSNVRIGAFGLTGWIASY